MARKNAPTIPQDELDTLDAPLRPERDDARTLDLSVDQEPPFLRAQKRVSVRKGPLPRKAVKRLGWAALVCGIVAVCALAAAGLYRYGEHSWRFRIDSSDDIEITGIHNVTRSQVVEVMGEDIGRNIFFVPLSERKAQLEQIPWVESASVMRFVPNHLKIEIQERTPVAFARLGSKILLVDRKGTLMDLSGVQSRKLSFPVIVGMNPGEPLSSRAPRMRIYNQLVSELDSGGAHYSQDLSEVDLSDLDDVKVVANDPGGPVLIHLGNADYLARYKIYVAHVREWRQQFDKLQSVDLRYDRQIIVNPDLHGALPEAPPVPDRPATLIKPANLATKTALKPATRKKPGSASTSRHTVAASHPSSSVSEAAGPSKPAVTAGNSRKPSAGIAKTQDPQ